jgi:hypothetical protein
MSHTKKSLKKITKRVSQQEICVLNETHRYLDGSELLLLLDNGVFVDISHSCFPCENEVRQKYAVAVNTRQIKYPYQLYRDTTIDAGFHNLILFSNITDKQRQMLEQLQKDLQVYNSEKTYNVKLETEDQKLAFLRQQNYFVKDYPNDKNKQIKYTIHMPIGRDFTLPSETAVINSLSKTVEIHPREMYVAVYKDELQ